MSDAISDPDSKTIPDIPGMNLYRNMFYEIQPAGGDRYTMFSPLGIVDNGRLVLFDSLETLPIVDGGADAPGKSTGKDYVTRTDLQIQYGLPKVGVVLFRSVVNLFNNLKYASVRNKTTRYSPRDATQSLLVENLSDVPVNLKYKLRTYIPLYSKMLGALVTKCDTLLSMLNLNTIEVDSYKGIPNLPAGTNDIRQYVNILKRGVNGNLVPVSANLVTEILLSSLDSSQGITVPTDEDGLAQMQNVFHSERDAPPAGEYLRDVCNSVRDSASTLQKNLADVEKELASAEKPRFLELGNGFLDNQMRLYKAVPFAPPSILSRWMNVFKLCTLNGKSYVSDTSLFPVHNPSSANYKLLYTISRIISSRNPSVPDMEFPYMEKAVSEFNQKNGTDMKLGRSWFTLFRFFVDSVAYQANYSTSDLFSTQMEQVERASDSSSVGYFTYGGSALKIMMEPSPEAVMRYLDPSLAPKGKSSGGQDAYYGESASAAPGGVSDVNKSILLLQKMLATLPPDILEEIKSDQHHDLLAYSILYAVYAKQKAATVELLRNFSSGSVISKVRATLAAMAGAAATAVEASKAAGFSTHPDYGAVHPATECLFALQTLIFLERLSYFYDKAMAYFKSKITESDYSTIVGMVGQYCAPIVFKESKASMSSLDQTVLDFFSSRAPILGSFMISNGNSVVPLQEVMFILLDKYKVLPFGLQTTDILNFPANSADSSTLEMYNQHARRVLEAVRTTDAKLLNVPDGEFSTRISREETRLNVTANQDAFNTNERIEILKCAFSSDLTCDVYGFLTEYLDRGAPQPDGMALSDFELAETKIRAERMDNVASVSKVLSDISYLDRQDINLFNPTEVATIHRVFTHYNIMPINVHALRSSIPLANIYNYAVTFDDMIKVHLGIKHPKDSSKLVMSEDRVLWEWYEHMQNPYRSLTDSSSSGSNGSADKSKVIVALALATMPALNSMRTGAAQTSASLLELLVPGVAAHKRTENVIKGQTSLGVSFMYQDGGHLAMPTDEYKDKIGQVIGRCDMDALYSLVSSADSISEGFKLPKSLISRLTGVPYSQHAGPRIAGAPDNGPVLFGAGVWYNQGNEPGNPFERPINDVYSNKLHRIYTYMFNAVSATSEFASAAHAAYKLLGKFVEARVRSTILEGVRQTEASIPASKSIVFSSQEEAFTTTLVFDPEAAGAAPVTLDNLMTVSKTNIPNNFEQEFKTWITNNAQDNQEDSAKLPADQNTRDRAIMVGTMLVHFMKDAEDLTDDTVYEALKSIQKLCYLCDVAARNSQNYKENYETDVTQFYAAYSSLDFANIKTDKPTPTKYVKPPDVTKDNVLLGPSEQINSRLLAFLIDQEAKDRPGTDYFSTVNEMWSLNNPSKIRTLISVLSDSGVQSAIVDSGSINLFIQSQIKPRLGLNRPRFLFDDVFNKVIFTLNSTSSDLSYGSSQRALEYLDQSNQRKFVINVDEDKKKELDVINNFRLNTVLLRCSIFTTNLFRALVTIMDKTMYVNTAMVKRGAAATQLSMVEQPGHREYH
ncbi:MAG TPA: hypothetical protein VFQ26_02090 [Nitrospiraceae bacterium]|nr:hypothetical protein [Nitrospiraceae bacterium]